MASSLPELNEDFQSQIMKAWCLSEVAKMSKMKESSRPDHTNQITLVNSIVHELYDSLVDRYHVYELRVDGFHIDGTSASWTGIVLFDKMRYLRLVVDFHSTVDA